MELGELISKYRKESGMTLEELASKSGVPKGTLNKIISGDTKSPTLDTMKSIAKALGKKLADFDDLSLVIKKASPYAEEAKQLAETYMQLDQWGRQLVMNTAKHEFSRVQDERRFIRSSVEDAEKKVIPLYLSAPAAGFAAPIIGEDYDDYELQEKDPKESLFAVRVAGDSMAPYFPDDSIVFCNKDPLMDGDIGVFSVDGDAVIKQYHYNKLTGTTFLYSLNRERADADIVISKSSGQYLSCLGKVITDKHFDIPKQK